MKQKSLKNVLFHLEEENELALGLGYIITKSNWIAVKPLFKSTGNGWLIERKHSYQQTQFILNESASCWLLSFNDSGLLVSKKKYFNSCSAPASFLIPETFVVLLPIDTSLQIAEVSSFEIKKNMN